MLCSTSTVSITKLYNTDNDLLHIWMPYNYCVRKLKNSNNQWYLSKWQKFKHKFHFGELPKICNECFQHTSSVHYYQSSFRGYGILLYWTCFKQCWKKLNFISVGGSLGWRGTKSELLHLWLLFAKVQDIVLSKYQVSKTKFMFVGSC